MTLIPFNIQGNLIASLLEGESVPLSACRTTYNGFPIEWKDNYQFDATMQLIDIQSEYPNIPFVFENTSTGALYPVFSSVMKKILLQKRMDCGRVDGRWTFVKRGNGYSLDMV